MPEEYQMRSNNTEVIVVEDDADLRFILCRRLTEAGYTPLGAANGLEALEKMVDHPDCRVLITDFMMPELGGDTWIRTLERFCDEGWSVIVVSAENIDPGRFVMSPKPIDVPNLISHLQRVA